MASIEEKILLFIQEHIRVEGLTPFVSFFTHLGNAGILFIVLTVFGLFFVSTRKAAISSALGLVIHLILCNGILKNAFARTRPYEVIDGLQILIEKQPDFSFPSGHTSAAFAFAVAVFLNMDRKYGIFALVLAFLMGLSRLYVGVHYPTDVLVGAIVGVLCGWLGSKLADLLMKKSKNCKKVD